MEFFAALMSKNGHRGDKKIKAANPRAGDEDIGHELQQIASDVPGHGGAIRWIACERAPVNTHPTKGQGHPPVLASESHHIGSPACSLQPTPLGSRE